MHLILETWWFLFQLKNYLNGYIQRPAVLCIQSTTCWLQLVTIMTADNGLNILRLIQNGCHFTDDVFRCIFVNESVWISLKISLKFVPKVPINNIEALVEIMAWCCSGNKPISETMMVSLLTHICLTRPQWVNKRVQTLWYCFMTFVCS